LNFNNLKNKCRGFNKSSVENSLEKMSTNHCNNASLEGALKDCLKRLKDFYETQVESLK
jgi:hypothetical protein